MINQDNYRLKLIHKQNDNKNSQIDTLSEKNVISNFFNLKINTMLQMVGNNGLYQKRVTLIVFFAQFIFSLISFSMPYIFYVPQYMCYDEYGNANSCKQIEACQNQFGYTVYKQRDSLITKFDLYCEKDVIYLTSQSFIFFFGAFAQLFFGFLSDRYGRKKMLLLSTLLLVIVIIAKLTNSSYISYLIIYTLLFSLQYIYSNIQYTYLPEIMSSDRKSLATGFGSLFFCFGNFVLLYLSSIFKDSDNILLIQIGFYLVLPFLYFMLVDSPYFYYKRKRILRLYKSLIQVSEINQEKILVQQNKNYLKKYLALDNFDIDNLNKCEIEKQNDQKLSPIRTIMNRFTRQDTMIALSICFLQFQVALNSTLIVNYPQYIGTDNMYLNIFVIGFGDIIAYFNFAINGYKMKRKQFVQIILIIEIILGLCLFSLTPLNLRNNNEFKMIQLILTFLIRIMLCTFVLICFIWTGELFSTQTRGLVIGGSMFFQKLASASSPFFLFLSIKYNIHPLSVMILTAPIVLFLQKKLPETLNKELIN